MARTHADLNNESIESQVHAIQTNALRSTSLSDWERISAIVEAQNVRVSYRRAVFAAHRKLSKLEDKLAGEKLSYDAQGSW